MRTSQPQMPAYLLKGPPTLTTCEERLPKEATRDEKKAVYNQALAELDGGVPAHEHGAVGHDPTKYQLHGRVRTK